MTDQDRNTYWQGWWQRRMTRRAAIGGGIGVAGIALIGCGGSDSTTSTATSVPSGTATATGTASATATPVLTSTSTNVATATGTPVPGGTLKIAGWSGGYTSWDPRSGDESDPTAYYTFTNDRLITYRYGPPTADGHGGATDFTPTPDLAESFEQIDATTLSIKVQSGIKWRNVDPVNGRELTAEDGKYSYEQYAAPESSFADSLKVISDLSVPDAYTLVVKTSGPFAPLINNMANPSFPIFAKEVIAKYGTLKDANTIIGTGPWYIDSFQTGVQVVFKKNPDYWRGANGLTKEGLPYLDTIEASLDPEWQTTVAQFRSGELAAPGSWFGFWGLEGQDAKDIQKLRDAIPGMQEELHARPYMDRHIWMRTDIEPFNDVRIRQAVSMAIDRQQWYENIYQKRSSFGREFAASNPWFLPTDQLGDGAQFQKFDVAAAKQLLEAAGQPDGFKTKIYTTSAVGPALQTESEFFAEEMRTNLGIETEFNIAPDNASWYSGAYVGNMDAGFGYGYGESFYDPDPFFDVYRTGHRRNRSHVTGDQELLDLLDKQRTELDPAARKSVVNDIQKHTSVNLYYIVTVDPPQSSAWQPWFKNWYMFDGADYGYTFIRSWVEV
jgi:peptide/nickel transport system substrate-binding protein